MADHRKLLPDITPDLHLSEGRVVLCESAPGYVALTSWNLLCSQLALNLY